MKDETNSIEELDEVREVEEVEEMEEEEEVADVVECEDLFTQTEWNLRSIESLEERIESLEERNRQLGETVADLERLQSKMRETNQRLQKDRDTQKGTLINTHTHN